MRTRTQQAEQWVEGAVTIAVWGSNALIRGFHGPLVSSAAAATIREAQTLTNVVGSFQVELATARQRFREPSQGAFDAMAPEGWNRVMDHVNHQWSNVTRGCTDVVDSSYGTVYSVPNDYDQYWRTNSGMFIGGSWGT
jgi:hypothetical protein